ncbi:MAG TPA: group II intron reverse transcriptase/maturase, partial [Ruminococcaceae bacterium]|nr:group II intron reverse transcriptase/maturase [Oscillospiraceae bacterium]
DNRISLFSAQWGKCAVTGQAFECVEDIHCHHKLPWGKGGTDKFKNLILVLKPIHKLIHATTIETINGYLKALNLKESQLAKVNELRKAAELEPIDSYNLKHI